MMESGKKPYLDDEKIAVLCEKLQCKAADVVISPPPAAPGVETAALESPLAGQSPQGEAGRLRDSVRESSSAPTPTLAEIAADCAAVKAQLAEMNELLHDLLEAGGLEALRRAQERRRKRKAG